MDEKNLTELGEQIVKHKRPKRSEQLQVHTKPGDNTKYLTHALKLANLPKFDTKNIPLLEERIMQYFQFCAEDDMKPSVAGLALAVGVNRKTIWQWAQAENSDRSNSIKKAYQILNLMMEDYMQNGKINPVSGIFLMKNNFGYTDKQELVVTPNSPFGQEQDTEEIKQRYLDSVVEEEYNEQNGE
ncbi:MAG: terminase small subunit [Acutalibacteraceae bacterium]